MAKKSKNSVIRVGVVGVGRGQSFAQGASEQIGMKLVALCDTWEERLLAAGKQYGVATYTDFAKFLEHDMDAIILANFFHQHAPFAIKALEAGFHVMSETTSCKTMAEGVALCRAVEKSKKQYMLAENYPYSAANQELRRLYQDGEIGEVTYAEGEYQHAAEEDWRLSISPGMNHWRNWLPPTYYCTHALAPLVHITDQLPTKVNAFSIVEKTAQAPHTVGRWDRGGLIVTRNENGSVFRLLGLMLSSIHRSRWEIHGETGLIGTADGDAWGRVKVHHEEWLTRTPQQPTDTVYKPKWPEHGDLARKAGHGGGDFWTPFHFGNAIRTNKPPFFDVYKGVNMAAVGILGWRSALEDGRPIDIPDFKNEKSRAAFENDHWSPFPEDAAPGQPAPSIRGAVEPSKKAVAQAKKVWDSIGYKGK